jgi:hypothetical protein
VEEQHVTQYGCLMDTEQTWLEGCLNHQYTECYLYWSAMETETDPRIKAIWEMLFEQEVSHLHAAAELLGLRAALGIGQGLVGVADRNIARYHGTNEVVDDSPYHVEYGSGQIRRAAVPLIASVKALVAANGIVKPDPPFVVLAFFVLIPSLCNRFIH